MIRGKQIQVRVYPFPTDLNRSMSRVVESLGSGDTPERFSARDIHQSALLSKKVAVRVSSVERSSTSSFQWLHHARAFSHSRHSAE